MGQAQSSLGPDRIEHAKKDVEITFLGLRIGVAQNDELVGNACCGIRSADERALQENRSGGKKRGMGKILQHKPAQTTTTQPDIAPIKPHPDQHNRFAGSRDNGVSPQAPSLESPSVLRPRESAKELPQAEQQASLATSIMFKTVEPHVSTQTPTQQAPPKQAPPQQAPPQTAPAQEAQTQDVLTQEVQTAQTQEVQAQNAQTQELQEQDAQPREAAVQQAPAQAAQAPVPLAPAPTTPTRAAAPVTNASANNTPRALPTLPHSPGGRPLSPDGRPLSSAGSSRPEAGLMPRVLQRKSPAPRAPEDGTTAFLERTQDLMRRLSVASGSSRKNSIQEHSIDLGSTPHSDYPKLVLGGYTELHLSAPHQPLSAPHQPLSAPHQPLSAPSSSHARPLFPTPDPPRAPISANLSSPSVSKRSSISTSHDPCLSPLTSDRMPPVPPPRDPSSGRSSARSTPPPATEPGAAACFRLHPVQTSSPFSQHASSRRFSNGASALATPPASGFSSAGHTKQWL